MFIGLKNKFKSFLTYKQFMRKKKSEKVSITLPNKIYEQMDDYYRIQVIELVLSDGKPPHLSNVYAQVLEKGLEVVKNERGIKDFKPELQKYRIDKRKH